MKTLHTVEITVSTKKGHSQKTLWQIETTHPWPYIGAQRGYLEWQNDEGITRSIPKLPVQHYASLLRSDFTPETRKDNREDRAGYTEYHSHYSDKPKPQPNPGDIVLRGCSLGEMLIRFHVNTHCPYNEIEVRGSKGCSKFERDFIEEQIVPALKQYIEEHKDEMYREALHTVEDRCRKEVSDKLKEIEKLRIQMNEALEKLFLQDNENNATR